MKKSIELEVDLFSNLGPAARQCALYGLMQARVSGLSIVVGCCLIISSAMVAVLIRELPWLCLQY